MNGGVPSAGSCECIEQKPQEFLTRAYYRGDAQRMKAAVDYRTRNYGKFPGFGESADNPHTPEHYSADTTFMGLPVRLNRRIIPALKCVERAIRENCSGPCKPDPRFPKDCTLPFKRHPYQPQRLSGLRMKNSFKGGQVSNHVYGIAIDLDPSLNTCCGCTAAWRENPLCKRADLTTPSQRMVMPGCWVRQFEKYGWFWLGDDRLQDTMHFAFLGDPARVESGASGCAARKSGPWLLAAGILAVLWVTSRENN